MCMVASRRAVEATFKNTDVFSSEGFLELGNVRPLIPLSVDPPRHLKYRKVLDPIFAPRQMDAIEDDVTARVNHFIDQFEAKGRVPLHPRVRRAVPVGGVPRPDGSAVGGARHVPPAEGRHHPSRHHRMEQEQRQQIQRDTGQELYAYFDAILDERLAAPKDDILTRFNTAEIDGEKLTREEILDICFLFFIAGLDTVTDSLACFFAFLAAARRPPAPDRGEPRHHPERGRGAAALGDAGAERAARWRRASARSPATRCRRDRSCS